MLGIRTAFCCFATQFQQELPSEIAALKTTIEPLLLAVNLLLF